MHERVSLSFLSFLLQLLGQFFQNNQTNDCSSKTNPNQTCMTLLCAKQFIFIPSCMNNWADSKFLHCWVIKCFVDEMLFQLYFLLAQDFGILFYVKFSVYLFHSLQTRCPKCYTNCCFIGQRANDGISIVGSNSSNVITAQHLCISDQSIYVTA